jgi:hypothetical protein
MISGQTLRVCPEGKPVSTIPDHALNLALLSEEQKMSPERTGTILGVIVAAVALAAAFIYVPIGSSNMAAKPAAAAPPSQAPAAPAAPRGPVVREVPN